VFVIVVVVVVAFLIAFPGHRNGISFPYELA
jgi:hypothetical protein